MENNSKDDGNDDDDDDAINLSSKIWITLQKKNWYDDRFIIIVYKDLYAFDL